MSNFTDLDALAAEPGVAVRYTRSPADIERADLVVVPGTKTTVADLASLRADGLDVALAHRAAAGGPILGICGGYQLLGRRIEDTVESRTGVVDGLGLLPVETVFATNKLLRRQSGTAASWLGGAAATGYEIRHGDPRPCGGEPLLTTAAGEPEGCVAGAVSARAGTACSRATRSAARCWPGSPASAAATGSLATSPSPTSVSAASTSSATSSTSTLTVMPSTRSSAGGAPEDLPTLDLQRTAA